MSKLGQSHSYRDEKLNNEEEAKCRDIVNALYQEMDTTFSEYRIPPEFFGPLQIVHYDGIGGKLTESVDDAEFIIRIGEKMKTNKFVLRLLTN